LPWLRATRQRSPKRWQQDQREWTSDALDEEEQGAATRRCGACTVCSGDGLRAKGKGDRPVEGKRASDAAARSCNKWSRSNCTRFSESIAPSLCLSRAFHMNEWLLVPTCMVYNSSESHVASSCFCTAASFSA
jgi:hypothetical protein